MSNSCSIAARCYHQTVPKALLYYALKKGGNLIHTIQLEVILYMYFNYTTYTYQDLIYTFHHMLLILAFLVFLLFGY